MQNWVNEFTWKETLPLSTLNKKTYLGTPKVPQTSTLYKAKLRLAPAYITGHGHFRNRLATAGLLQGDASCTLSLET